MSNELAWRLADLPPPTGPSVFSAFHCGGGSSMGYRLAGCDVIGGVEISKHMVKVYRKNLRPRVSFVSDIRHAPLPTEAVDILDGSPPCSSFSTAGDREKSWGRTKAFSEGGAKQRLDNLFFEFIEYAAKVAPRVIVAENVPGLLHGNARAYARRIVEAFKAIGYTVQLFQLSAAHFGVPQARVRLFFVAQPVATGTRLRIVPSTTKIVTVGEALADLDARGRPLTGKRLAEWKLCKPGQHHQQAMLIAGRRGGRATNRRLNSKSVSCTLCASGGIEHWSAPNELSGRALARLQSFPDDYNFLDQNPAYVCGMSVPPFVMRAIATQIVAQVF